MQSITRSVDWSIPERPLRLSVLYRRRRGDVDIVEILIEMKLMMMMMMTMCSDAEALYAHQSTGDVQR